MHCCSFLVLGEGGRGPNGPLEIFFSKDDHTGKISFKNLKRVRSRLVVQRSGVVHILQIVRYVYSMFCFGCGQLCEAETEFGFLQLCMRICHEERSNCYKFNIFQCITSYHRKIQCLFRLFWLVRSWIWIALNNDFIGCSSRRGEGLQELECKNRQVSSSCERYTIFSILFCWCIDWLIWVVSGREHLKIFNIRK